MATYDRDGVIEYAQTWCNSHNPDYPFYDGTGGNTDCANFVSQCMHEGGGVPMKDTAHTSGGYDVWYYYGSGNRSSSWTGAQSLRLFVKYNEVGYPRMPYSFLSNSEVGELEKGDLVFALNDDGTNKSNRTAGHVAVVSRVSGSSIYVYAHSEPKDDELWNTSLDDTILCHFTGEILTGDSSTTPSDWQSRYGTATLRPSNSYNAYVKNLQEDLISIGYSCGSAGADGYFGSSTTNSTLETHPSAVKAFQRNTNGLEVDGLVGNATKQALYAAVFG